MGTQSSTNTFEPMGNLPTGSPASLPTVMLDDFGNTWVDLSGLSSSTLEELSQTSGVSLERLPGRMAAQEAVAVWLRATQKWQGMAREIRVENTPSGSPILPDPVCEGLFLSLSHCGFVGVARLATHPFVGVDLESIKPRGEAFEKRAFSKSERQLLPFENREEWVTRFWAAKESVGKAQGTGLNFAPTHFPIQERSGEYLRVGDSWVSSRISAKFVVAWTVKSPVENKKGTF